MSSMTTKHFYLFLERIADGERAPYESNWLKRDVFSVPGFKVNKHEMSVKDLKTNQSYSYRIGANIPKEAMEKYNITFPNKNPDYYSCFMFQDGWNTKNATCMLPKGKLSQVHNINFA